jgi:hypothetical protein
MNMPPSPPQPAGIKPRDLMLLRVLLSIIASTLIGLGVLAIRTQHLYSRTKSGAEFSLDGPAAIAGGAILLLFGMVPLAVWFNTGRHRLMWALSCAFAAMLVLGYSLYFLRA